MDTTEGLANELGPKQKRRKWHEENKMLVFEHFDGVCQICLNPIVSKWDVHHLSYSYERKLYQTPALELIEKGIITLLCRPCHNKEHTASDPKNPKRMENTAACEICGNFERGIFDRKRNLNLGQLLCKKCFRNQKKGVVQLSLFQNI